MKKSTGFRKGEEGMALVYVTLVLVMTMLVIPPLLNFIGGAGRTAQIREDRMLTVYAADAGIEDGYYRIMGNSTQLDSPWNISDVNGCNVTIEIQQENEDIYKITSTATSWEGVDITIQAYTSLWDYSFLFENAVSSWTDIWLSPTIEIRGNVTLNGEPLGNGWDNVQGNVTRGIPAWPKADELSEWYWTTEVENNPYTYGYPLLVAGNESISLGPCYTDRDLVINKYVTPGGNVTLGGTLYIKGDLTVFSGVNIKLSGKTIYAEGGIEFKPGSFIFGPGCIIAAEYVYFAPNIENDEFIFAMSAAGEVTLKPNGDFYGSVAGNVRVEMSNASIEWKEYDPDLLDFPLSSGDLPGIITYTILD